MSSIQLTLDQKAASTSEGEAKTEDGEQQWCSCPWPSEVTRKTKAKTSPTPITMEFCRDCGGRVN